MEKQEKKKNVSNKFKVGNMVNKFLQFYYKTKEMSFNYLVIKTGNTVGYYLVYII